jgi:hypothetical protein
MDSQKDFFKIGKTIDGRLWMSSSNDGLNWSG